MVRTPGTQSDQSFFTLAKNSIFAGLITLLVVSCQSQPKILITPPVDYLLVKGGMQITYEGSNDSPSFSPQGDRLLFVSEKRSAHRNRQIYEYDLSQNRERRITFQDGEVRHPTYLRHDKILYASSTDEIKENLASLFNEESNKKEHAPLEIYESDLYGNRIYRLTNEPGYDAEPAPVPLRKYPYLVFTSYRDGALGLFKLDLHKRHVSSVSVEKTVDKLHPAVSSNLRELAWVAASEKDKTWLLRLSPIAKYDPKTLKTETSAISDLSFVPGKTQLLYSIQRGDNPKHIEVYDYTKNCTQVVFSGKDPLIQPTLNSLEPYKIAFTRVLESGRQIYVIPWPAELGPCLESQL